MRAGNGQRPPDGNRARGYQDQKPLICQYPGDITIMTGEVIDKMVDAEGRHLVQLTCRMANQLGATMATAKAEVELPTK